MATVMQSKAPFSPFTPGITPIPSLKFSSLASFCLRKNKCLSLALNKESRTNCVRSLVDSNSDNSIPSTSSRKSEGSDTERLSFLSADENAVDDFKLFSIAPLVISSLAESPGYSEASYYTTLGLFILSLPGVYSLVKRSVRSKIVKKTFVVPGPASPNAQPLSQVAGEITSFLARRNFQVTDRGETVTFEGLMVPSKSQASFLVFCTALTLLSVGLVLTILVPEGGSNWYFLALLSPVSGFYYWSKASRKEEIKVKMVVSDDESSTDIILQGDDAEVERMSRELKLMEKDMVYVKGIFEQ